MCCCLLSPYFFPTYYQRADLKIYDFLCSEEEASAPPLQAVVLDIDDQTLSAVGQWPWPRYVTASLVEALQRLQPRLIMLDILFAEKDRTSLREIRDRYKRHFDIDLDFVGLPPGLDDNDGYLADVLRRVPTVGSLFFLHDLRNPSRADGPTALDVDRAELLADIPDASGVLRNIPVLQDSLDGVGFINVQKDEDGILRRLFMLYRYDGKLYPHIVLAGLMRVLQIERFTVERTLVGFDLCGHTAQGEKALVIPVGRDGSALLRVGGKEQVRIAESAVNVLEDRVSPAFFADRVVVVGSSASGLNDFHHVSGASVYAGGEIQAFFINNALARRLYRWPEWGRDYGVALSAATGGGILALFAVASPLLAALGSLAVFAISALTSVLFFHFAGVYLPAAAPAFTSILMFGCAMVTSYIREHRNFIDNLHAIIRTRQLTLESMAAIAEMRSVEGGAHIRRTQHFAKVLAERLRASGRFPLLTDKYIALLFYSAPLHDLGKVAIPDAILFKPGRLTPEEFDVMKEHTVYGCHAIEQAARGLDEDHFLRLAAEVALTHHERWDGTGYPRGLAREAIPLSGRIMALADVYDALTSKRVYKERFTHEKAKAIIVEGRGTHFDPCVVDAFLAEEDAFRRLAERGVPQDSDRCDSYV